NRVRRCEFIIKLLTIHAEEAVLLVLNLLDWQEVQTHPGPYLVHLLTAVSCFELCPDDRRRAANLAGRYLMHVNSRVRETALRALEQIGGREVLLPAARALTAARYGRELPAMLSELPHCSAGRSRSSPSTATSRRSSLLPSSR